jgi:hypothetical protein
MNHVWNGPCWITADWRFAGARGSRVESRANSTVVTMGDSLNIIPLINPNPPTNWHFPDAAQELETPPGDARESRDWWHGTENRTCVDISGRRSIAHTGSGWTICFGFEGLSMGAR